MGDDNRTIEPMRLEDIGVRSKTKYPTVDEGHINFWDDRATMLAWATGKMKAKSRAKSKEYRDLKKEMGI